MSLAILRNILIFLFDKVGGKFLLYNFINFVELDFAIGLEREFKSGIFIIKNSDEEMPVILNFLTWF